jgi:hypothetical protein
MFKIMFTTLLFALLCTTALRAEVRNIRVSFSNPDTAHYAAIAWTTDSPNEANTLQYGYVAPGQFKALSETTPGPGDLGTIHVVYLEDLEADTEYQYRIGDAGNWSPTKTFHTAPEDPCVPFRFAAFGDNRPDADWLPQLKWNPILEETASVGPDFVLHTGDIVKEGKDVQQWKDFFNNSDPVLASLPLMASIGNHDDGPAEGEGANFNQLFVFPTNEETGTEDFYYFKYGNAIVVSLSSQTFGEGDTPFGMQAAWLDKVLTENPAQWKFVMMHHPPYTSHEVFDLIFTEFEFNHPPDEKGYNSTLVPIFDKHHVDIVFAGHNHYYERIGPVVMGSDPAVGEQVASFDQGTVYVITGGAGALVYDEFNIPWINIEIDLIDWVCGKNAPASQVCAGDHHYVTIDIDDGHLHYEARATAQQTLAYDLGNQALIDVFDVFKDPAEECLVQPVEPDIVEQSPEYVEAWAPEVIETPEVVSQPDLVGSTEIIQTDGQDQSPGELPAAEGWSETAGGELLGNPEPYDVALPSEGCGCRTHAREFPSGAGALLLLLAAIWAVLRRVSPTAR